MQDIWLTMDEFDSGGIIKFDQPPYDADATLLLQKVRRIGERLTLFHYSGHANDHLFQLQNGNYGIDQLLALLSGKKPNLVFLNGCSTYGYVDALLEHGVKAVIATTQEVKDISAREFAKEFYNSLALNKTLGVAFDEASSRSTFLSTTARKQKRSGSLPPEKKAEPCPWDLYYLDDRADYNQTGENISILDWKLVSTDRTTLRLPPNFQEQRRKITELISQRDVLVKKLRRIETDLKVYQRFPFEDWDIDMREQFSEKKLEKEETETNRDALIQKIEATRAAFLNRLKQNEESKVATRLIEPVSLLNYSEPREYVRKWLTDRQSQSLLFMLQGTSACGLPLLQARILNRLRFPFDSEESCLRLVIECHSTSQVGITKDTLWKKLQEDRNVGGNTPQEMVVNLFQQLYTGDTDSRNLLLLIKGAIHCSKVTYILDFWTEFNQLFTQQPDWADWSQQQKRVILVVRYEAQESIDELAAPQQQIREVLSLPSSVCIVPVVPTFPREEIKKWTQEIDDFADIDLTQFDESDNRMLPVLRNIANQIDCKPLFELIQSRLQ